MRRARRGACRWCTTSTRASGRRWGNWVWWGRWRSRPAAPGTRTGWSTCRAGGRVAKSAANPVGVSCPDGSCPPAYDCHAEDSLCHKSDGRPWKTLTPVTAFFFDGISGSGYSGDARALAFSTDGNRLYLVSRTPSSLKVFDTSIDATGAPRNALIGVMEICDQPATLELADFGRGLRVVVPCFLTGQVWVVDPATLTIESVEDVGRGPTAVAVSLSRKRIYVANYAEDTLSVLDATPGARTEARMVLRIGTPRPTE